ncbi:kinetochore-associated protein KNL-2 homolog isoform X3 [Vigna unguiculata]|uniref:kinetochore-associated protein KNL-2 homolog isoform X3 n=1 Tax=Vigna unguiculata TaxID=3917 RepID=UPI00101647E1|nr:kinetochore-associated protein KNL-2 homolog isoform X3 [Vigna unguiculata]
MADSTPTATPSNDTQSCVFLRTVTLYDWWLIKATNDFQGKRLAVAGISSRKDEAMRVFVSAPVIERYDVFSLMTADGIYLIISGFINEQRTIENGFDPQILNRFLFGFPPDWKTCALDFSREESTTANDLGSGFLDDVPASCSEILSDGVENCTPTFLASPEKAQGDQEKAFPENECNVSKEVAGVNVACSRGRKRRSARLHDVKVYQRKKQSASGLPPKNPNNKNHISEAALDNCDVVGPKSPETPIQSQSWRQLRTSSEQIVKKSASRISRTLSPKTEGCQKKKVGRPKGTLNKSASAGKNSRSRDLSHLTKGSRQKNSTVSPESSSFRTLSPETEGCHKKKVGRHKGSLNKSASAEKNSRSRDLSHLTKESRQKNSIVSPESWSFRTSRSGRLLVRPLEFWRNQIPIYDADHVLKEIKDGASLISPCKVSSSSSRRTDFD